MAPTGPARPPCVVVMGVSGVGKTTTARLLAERLGVPFADADDFHPAASIAKMSAGKPLDDADRRPWLEAIGRWLHERDLAGTGGVVPCSALRRSHRDLLRTAAPGVFFLHLDADPGVVAARMRHRTGHFMPPSLLASQLAALEPLAPEERGASVDAGLPTAELVGTVVDLLSGTAGGSAG